MELVLAYIGQCTYNDWRNSLSKIGVNLPEEVLYKQLFQIYDTNNDGKVDYKEFTDILYHGTPISMQPSPKKEEVTHVEKPKENVEVIIEKLRSFLISKGIKIILGIWKEYKIIDDGLSGYVTFNEFKKGLMVYKANLKEEEIEKIYSEFIPNNNEKSCLNYKTFMEVIIGKASQERIYLIHKVFTKLDKQSQKRVRLDELKTMFSAKDHPGVQNGTKKESEILSEFFESIDCYHNIIEGKRGEPYVTEEEFESFYNIISFTIEKDITFSQVMCLPWRIKQIDMYPVKEKKQIKTPVQPEEKEEEQQMPAELPSPPEREPEEEVKQVIQEQSPQVVPTTKETPLKLTDEVNYLLNKIRKKLSLRGPRGIIGLTKQFKQCDYSSNQLIDYADFKKAMKDYKMDLQDVDLDYLFKSLNERKGYLNYNMFVRAITGRLNEFRKHIVELAFLKMDITNSGKVNISEIKGKYNGRYHPDVRGGKKTEDEAVAEFLETYEMYHNFLQDKASYNFVALSEFEAYYEIVSSSIEDDSIFEQMMTGCWRIYGESSTNTDSQRKPMVTPYGTSDQYSYAQVKAAGVSSWPKEKPHQKSMPQLNLCQQFKDKIASRGGRGLLGLRKVYANIDFENKGISFKDFVKGIKDFRLKIEDDYSLQLFRQLDEQGKGIIKYDDFFNMVLGEQSLIRKSVISKIFKKVNNDVGKVVDIEAIKNMFNPCKHPEVISRKKTEDDVLTEVFDTLELYAAMVLKGKKCVDLKELEEYYAYTTFFYDDKYFEHMMMQCWELK